jgi:radical SAM superfamily enzyme YgiQ (UPF0313 family)
VNIALIYPRWTSEYGIFGHFAKAASVWPPLILAYLAALAEQDGHNVIIIDAEAENLPIPAVITRLRDFNVDVIGITATTPFFHTATKMGEQIKNAFPNVPLVIGGHHVTSVKEEGFYPCFDYAFIGEAEISWMEFLRKYSNKEDVTTTKGILYRKDGKVIFTGEANRVEDVNTLPLPARHLLKPHLYNLGTLQGKKQFTSIYTIWGCPFRCIFCCTGAFIGKKMRKKDPKAVIEEIKHVIKTDGTKHFLFLDDTLTMDRPHIMEICNLIIKEKLDITFEGGTRANLVDEELIKTLKQAGLTRLCFGLEAVDEKIRKIMRKEVPLDAYVKANEISNRYGIQTLNSCMIGLPGESREAIEKTLDFLDKQREIKQANIAIAVPYPGTELYHMAKRGDYGLKLLTEDYSKYIRYNSAVMQVGDLSPDDLIELQNYAFLSVYTAPWRLKSMISRSQNKALFLMSLRFVKYVYALLRGSKNVTWRIFRFKK